MPVSSQSLQKTGAELQLAHLTKRFDDILAVDDISIQISGGEFLTLLGPSGSGKTTTLMMIAGLQAPTSGEIFVDGKPLAGLPPYRRGFGMVFQSYALFPHMTVAENVGFPLRMRSVPSRNIVSKVREVLELVHLPGYGDRYPRQLSGGQQQRVALARALVFNPPVLLMDEPLGALDRKLREEMQLEIKRIHSQLDITAIYVTHDQEEALVMSDRIAVLNRGQIEQVDTPTGLYERPTTRFVASFVGESNIIPVEFVQSGGKWCGRTSGGHMLTLPQEPPRGTDKASYLIIRPEKVRFADEESDLANTMEGTVADVIYVGDVTKYKIEVSGKLILFLKRQNRSGQRSYDREETVMVGWHATDGVLPTE
jgi:spermidine/putrescine ABC transporter ATP-binding subunit